MADESWRGKIGRLSDEDLQAFFATDVIAKLGCLDAEGWPYVVPVWFEYADGGYYVIPRARSAWAGYLQNDPRVSLCIDEAAAQNRRVLVKGHARILETPNVGGRWVPIAERMATRYLGPHGPDYLVPTLNEPRWLIFVEPIETRTWQGVDWHPRYKHAGRSDA